MKNIFKGLSLVLVALLLVVGVGASSAGATSTYAVGAITETGALTVTSAGALGLVAGANAINIGADATAKTITIGSTTTTSAVNVLAGTGASTFAVTGTGTLALGGAAASGVVTLYGGTSAANTLFPNVVGGTITIGGSSQTGATTIYGGSTTNAVRVLATVGTVSSESHGLDVVTTGTFATTADNLVGVNSVLTPDGSSGQWASAVYGKVVQAGAQRLSGYMSGGEFEIANSVTGASNEMFPLVLDANNTSTYHPASAFIWAQDFGGGSKMPNFASITGTTIGTGNMVQTTSDVTATHTLKIMINGTAYYILLSTVQ